jgi:hypothetical protein
VAQDREKWQAVVTLRKSTVGHKKSIMGLSEGSEWASYVTRATEMHSAELS